MRYSYRGFIRDHDVASVFAWHERPGALQRLTPPWGEVEVLEQTGGIRDGARVRLRVHGGPASFEWALRHRDFELNRRFVDEQVSGPLASWVHTHGFRSREGGTELEDDIEAGAPLGAAGDLVAPGFIRRELDRLFPFRYRRLQTDLDRHAEHADKPRLTVAITGASGMIGSNLHHFLTTGGHRVLRLVRRREEVDDDALYWNPRKGEIDVGRLEQADALVHLAGEPIAGGRWSDARKERILRSREEGTRLVARALAELEGSGPSTLVSMSGVNWYGFRGDERLDESSTPGGGFLGEVTRVWEAATKVAEEAGVRVVRVRAGVVLSPQGGALGKMLLPFKVGVGGRIAGGDQYMSWIDLDDMVAVLHHVLMDDTIHGPVNATAPHPVTNATFTSALGRVLGRPTLLPVPGLAVKAVFGELGEETLLRGQRVLPRKLQEGGFSFRYEGVEESLRFQLGRMEE
jgi:hypothetical protein